MEKLLFINYIKMRIKERRTNTPMGDLISDMEGDMKALEGCGSMIKISSHIQHQACYEAWETFKRFRCQYRKYCRDNNYEMEEEKK